jgi:hydrogenase maturation protein HypF
LSIIQSCEIQVRGLVQGVGFRPFIYRLARKHNLNGDVDNRINGVLINVEGDEERISDFLKDIIEQAPPASQIKTLSTKQKKLNGYSSFKITPSNSQDNEITEISPDIAVCNDCLADLDNDPGRTNYPFTNCTNCGPRFSIIEALPYDRVNTSMKDFKMCERCQSEYNDISDRRFHAQPVACNNCGPVYTFRDLDRIITDRDVVIKAVSGQISQGKSVALKGMGGYHLICDALNKDAVDGLRKRKHRDAKPFAVMFRDLSSLKMYCQLDPDEEEVITSWRRPVVILREIKMLSAPVNCGLGTIGAILPYLPLHYLLFRKVDTPALVLTSGNISDEPVIKDDDQAIIHLMPIAGSVVYNNRKIINRTDDSVVRIAGKSTVMIRRSRGYAPSPVDLDLNVDGILALGAGQKNSFCIGKDRQAIMSQYIGDLENQPTYEFFRDSIERYMSLFRFVPNIIACDLHPGYISSFHAGLLEKNYGTKIIRIQHHHAHIASVMAENHLDEKVIGVSFDGTGYGTDGNSWGSEFMIADLNDFNRYSHFDYMPMPGGDLASDQPWRMAFSYLYKYFRNTVDFNRLTPFQHLDPEQIHLLKEMIDKGINSPLSSGAGRLFDAVSAILGLCTFSGFDSEAPMRLESAVHSLTGDFYPFTVGKNIVFKEMFRTILEDISKGEDSYVPAKFHNTVSHIIADVCDKMRNEFSINRVALSGGVFQNKYLLEKSLALLHNRNFEVFINHLVPPNDGGVSLGQIAIAAKRRKLCA